MLGNSNKRIVVLVIYETYELKVLYLLRNQCCSQSTRLISMPGTMDKDMAAR